MKVSIITATYNSVHKLQRAIDAVAQQDYPDLEHILIDGGSTDGTLELIQKNQERIAHVISEKDNGIYDALNKGIHLATGHIIGFLHSDDVFENEKVISTIVQKFKECNADVVYGNVTYLSHSDGKKRLVRYWASSPFDPKSLKFGWMPPHPTVYCKREVYEDCGLYDASFRIAADYDFILRLFQNPKYKKVHIPNVLVNMDMGGISNSSIKNIIKKSKEDWRAIKKNKAGNFWTIVLKNLRKLHQFWGYRQRGWQ